MTAGLSRLLLAGLLGVTVIWAAGNWNLGLEREPVADAEDAGEKVLVNLELGSSYSRVVRVGSRAVTGVLLYSAPGLKPDGEMKMTVRRDGQEISQARSVRYGYRKDSSQLFFDLENFSVPDSTDLMFEVTRISGGPVPLQMSPTGGLLTMSLVYPVLLDDGVKQGVLVGVVVMLAVALLGYAGRRRWLAAGLILALTVPLALGGFWWTTGELGVSDWDYFFSLHHYYRQTIFEYGQFPFWNPYTCGGTAGLADPEFSVLSPLYPLELWFGVSAGLRLAILVSVAAGGVGVLCLGRRLKLSVLAAFLAALTWSFGSATILKLVEGHVYILSAMWIPWIFWAWLGAYRRSRLHAMLGGIFLAFMFYQGGIYLLFYLVPSLFVLSLLVADRRRGLLITAEAGLWALGLAAVKLMPSLFWLSQFQDQVYAFSTYTLPYLHEILLTQHKWGEYVLPQQGGGWHEYGAYVGPTVVALALLGITAVKRRLVKILLLAVFGLGLLSSMGPYLKTFFDVLPYLPRSYTSRAIVLAVLPLALLGGIGLDVIGTWSRTKFAGALKVVIVGLAAVSIISLSYPLSEQTFVLPDVLQPLPVAPKPIAFTGETHVVRYGGQDYDRTYAVAKQGYGELTYCSALGPPIAVKAWQEEGSEYVTLAQGVGQGQVLNWRPNDVVIRVDLKEAGVVVINTNYAWGWQADGKPARNVGGRVGADVMPGQRDIIFTYRAPGFVPGLLMTVVAAIAVAVKIVMARPRRKPGV